jgi:acetyl esterase/lipase
MARKAPMLATGKERMRITGRRKLAGYMLYALPALLLLAICAFAVWRWAAATQAVSVLNLVDGWFTSAGTELAAGPVSYGEDPAQRLYIHRARGAPEGRPVLVFIHGGGWRSGDPADYAYVARNFAPHGFVVVTPGYRLDEAGRFPAMLEDGAKAIGWVRGNIAKYGGDPSRIYLMGHSAGAYIGAMLALDRQWLAAEGIENGAIDGFVGLAGPFDFLPLDTDSTRRAFGHADSPEATQPVNFARGDAPPMLLASGSEDTLVRPRNSIALARALSEAGAPTEPVILDGLDHADLVVRLARPFDRDPRVKDAVLAFLVHLEKKHGESSVSSVPVQGESR